MANKQIHELPAASALAVEDQLIVSQAGNTRRASLAGLPFKLASANARSRTLADKLGELVSVKDFGAVGDGTTDDSAAFQAAVDAHRAVFIPPGTYRLNSPIQVKPQCSLLGAGRDATVIDARAARAFVFHRNDGSLGGTPDWNRSLLARLSIRMAVGGILAYGHEFRAHELRFSGGQPSGWCIELEDANECCLREISAGPGGGGDDLLANGIRLYGTEANKGVNFGDSLLEEIAIKLKSANTIGILIEHLGTAYNGRLYVMNNLLINRVQVNSAAVPKGSTGIWLKRVMRSALVNVDVEQIETAFRVEGEAGGGNPGGVRYLSFINCYVLNCTTPWVDSNGTLAGSVMRCLFTNCNGFGLINPVGVAGNDPLARAGDGDSFLPGALWLTEPGNGRAAVQLRAPNPGQLLLASDYHDGESPTRDGNPKNPQPRKGLGIDITGIDTTRIYRPRGYADGKPARLVVGNGEGHASGALHRVEIADPLLLTPRTAEPPAPQNGMVVYCENAAALPPTTPWTGAGWYTRLAGGWVPGVSSPGRIADRERNTNFALTPFDFGAVHRINSAAAINVTIGSTYTIGGATLPLMQAGDPDAMLWLIRQGAGEVTIQAGDANVQVLSPGSSFSPVGNNVNVRIRRQYQLVALVLRFNPTSGKIEVYTNAIPDAEPLYEAQAGWIDANQGSNRDNAPWGVGPIRAGQLTRVSSSDPVSYIAFDANSIPANTTVATFRFVTVLNPIRFMARVGASPAFTLQRSNVTSPNGFPCFEVTERGRVVTVHVVGNSPIDDNQDYAIYVEG